MLFMVGCNFLRQIHKKTTIFGFFDHLVPYQYFKFPFGFLHLNKQTFPVGTVEGHLTLTEQMLPCSQGP